MQREHRCSKKNNSEVFRDKRNYLVTLQSVLIGLLNKHFEVTIIPPKKRSTVALQVFHIGVLKRGEDVIDFDCFTTKRQEEIFKWDLKNGITQKTAMRRLARNKVEDPIQILIDVLRELGYTFHSVFTSGQNGAPITEKVMSVTTPENEILGKEYLIRTGEEIHRAILAKQSKNETLILSLGDEALSSYFVAKSSEI
ncbi:hypothetical protein EIN_227660 [Entamoeba invadens IP1]|uniref:Uncharacterized protein n=1 Tax=Entamoeba invadens IP1 TaxID=370355 RepID=A0A0A1U8N3_ENTIV|nr:hypothetical protein EIN_227660 [Entamoeba invadens IP1]ELP88343.1 hypothetical protein EIN_227660 [Entamoeba invadens IP1]|eukprot:XP_004255114.1 hypothetical protein EIN_227660 [Entamoeba invadens IP1]